MELLVNLVFGLYLGAGVLCLACMIYYNMKGGEAAESAEPVSSGNTGDRPQNLLEVPTEGEKDDLKRINGIGPKLEESLNSLGVYHFEQIAQWSEKELHWIDDYLSFKGRAKRDDWIGQAQSLASE